MKRMIHVGLTLSVASLLALLLTTMVGMQPAAHADGNTIKVPDDHSTIQAAIDAATDGDEIRVASGTYSENLSITEGITLTGGWSDDFSTRSPGDSIIDGNRLGRVISITCATSDTVVTVDGFTIQNGDATGLTAPEFPAIPDPDNWSDRYPDGVFSPFAPNGASDSAMTGASILTPPAQQMAELRARLADLESRGLYPGGADAYQALLGRLDRRTIQAEKAQARTDAPTVQPMNKLQQEPGLGGGIYSWKASPHLLNNYISENVATRSGDGWGGGVYVSYAAPSGVLIANNEFELNEASEEGQGLGGGLLLFVAPSAVITGNIFSLNTASDHGNGWGGGVNLNTSSDVIFQDNLVTDNVGASYGSGKGGGLNITTSPGAHITDNDFQGNVASNYGEGNGGGLYIFGSSAVIVEGNSILENVGLDAGPYGEGIGSGGGLMVDTSTDVTVRDNLVEGNTGNAKWYSAGGTGGGILLWIANGAIVTDNVIRANLASLNGTGGAGGLIVFWTQGALVANNEVSGNWGIMFAPLAAGSAGGGGIGLDHVFRSTVSDNEIRENTGIVYKGSACFGGGLFVTKVSEGLQLTGNSITANVACLDNEAGFSGGGGGYIGESEDVVVSGNTIVDNVAGIQAGAAAGGGLFLRNTIGSQILGNRFSANKAGMGDHAQGGGLMMDSFPWGSRLATVDGNLFLNNQASADPSAVGSFGGACRVIRWQDGYVFTNNVLAGNQAFSTGGLALDTIEHASVVNNTFVENTGSGFSIAADASGVDFTNNVVVSHTVGIFVSEEATATVRYNLWSGNGADISGSGTITHSHPITGTPAFVDPTGDDYHLTVASAARDAGDPAGVPPAPDHDLDGIIRPLGLGVDVGAYEWQGEWLYLPMIAAQSDLRTGWAIGGGVNGGIGIVHTSDGGQTWEAQGDSAVWQNLSAGDISAVDSQTAWAAGTDNNGYAQNAILKTTDEGTTWVTQTYPISVTGGIKGIKGLSRDEAWAASLDGVLLHTTDGGDNWAVVPHPGIAITQVNRIDAMGTHVWIADAANGGAVVHSTDSGASWRAEYLPDGDSPLTVHVFSPTEVWVSGSILSKNPTFYRTLNGGDQWVTIKNVGGLDHLDDVCAAGVDDVWGALNGDDSAGRIWRVHVAPDGTPEAKMFAPPELDSYPPGGVTCLDAQVVWVAASVNAARAQDPTVPKGYILHTTDGGESWVRQAAPTDIRYWKISMVGARR